MNILIVHKTPKIESIDPEVLQRFYDAGITTPEDMEKSAETHNECLEHVCKHLNLMRIKYAKVSLKSFDSFTKVHDINKFDLIITVGGDGTVLGASRHILDNPVLAINSDSKNSIGALTRYTIEDWFIGFTNFVNYSDSDDAYGLIWRLQLQTKNIKKVFLNDILLTNENPAAMSIYRVIWPGMEENQNSSGVWISTASGSTGGFQSAGGIPCDRNEKALLWKVREPCKVKSRPWVVDAWQRGDDVFAKVIAITPLSAYVDGSHDVIHIDPGDWIEVSMSNKPLRLFTMCDSEK
jgi:NAD+ kinase